MLERNSQKNIVLTCATPEENDTHVINQGNSIRRKLNENTDGLFIVYEEDG